MVTNYIGTSGATLLKAGLNVSSVMTTDANEEVETFIRMAESYVNTECKHNFSDDYSGLNDDVKYILAEAVNSLAAIDCIAYDIGSYGSETEAQLLIDINWAKAQNAIKILKEKQYQDFISGA